MLIPGQADDAQPGVGEQVGLVLVQPAPQPRLHCGPHPGLLQSTPLCHSPASTCAAGSRWKRCGPPCRSPVNSLHSCLCCFQSAFWQVREQ